jgi:hypothetical protein
MSCPAPDDSRKSNIQDTRCDLLPEASAEAPEVRPDQDGSSLSAGWPAPDDRAVSRDGAAA